MYESEQHEADALAIKACDLFMATYQEPDNQAARDKLMEWAKEAPAHWRAFLALDQYLAEVKGLIEGDDLQGVARRVGRSD
ncbi:hypothetical protein N5D79_05930 [Pseudomonas sp. GD03817]|mgnify:CR=1 FL=1|uniref:Uncharacterized protein n=1 Tax=Pseudomonas putida TaxID=303 RepID=A0A1L5PSX4_PSEPU|nr:MULTISPECIES: hypothetical protein [Pseudomonas]APO83249.1 hypothetical protein BL240_18075 [Pseudomonas putida]MBA6136285.1 hypothetical protein [Pseudomonas monteilii]MCE0989566.1 hypothetical protein [Pseudomonas alloputida]MDH1400812.1 hypothetical protein [Pseudomonas sp. GD03730]MDH1774424.1 hypothetical protein [Pseudomonas sp. GD03817]